MSTTRSASKREAKKEEVELKARKKTKVNAKLEVGKDRDVIVADNSNVSCEVAIESSAVEIPKNIDRTKWSENRKRIHQYVICLRCGKEVQLNSSALRVHDHRAKHPTSKKEKERVVKTSRRTRKTDEGNTTPIQTITPSVSGSNVTSEDILAAASTSTQASSIEPTRGSTTTNFKNLSDLETALPTSQEAELSEGLPNQTSEMGPSQHVQTAVNLNAQISARQPPNVDPNAVYSLPVPVHPYGDLHAGPSLKKEILDERNERFEDLMAKFQGTKKYMGSNGAKMDEFLNSVGRLLNAFYVDLNSSQSIP